jgi:hypothetical protein
MYSHSNEASCCYVVNIGQYIYSFILFLLLTHRIMKILENNDNIVYSYKIFHFALFTIIVKKS